MSYRLDKVVKKWYIASRTIQSFHWGERPNVSEGMPVIGVSWLIIGYLQRGDR